MWFRQSVVTETEECARFYYVDAVQCSRWNRHRGEDELRLLTGWAWISKKDNREARQGFKTKSVAMRDAYYTLVQRSAAEFQRPKLKVVSRKAA